MPPLRVTFLIVTATSACTSQGEAAPDDFVVPDKVKALIQKRCADCHEGEAAEDAVRFDTIEQLELATRLDLLNKAQEQVFSGLMPPTDQLQPSDAERTQLVDWMSRELRRLDASRLDEALKRPEYGNYVDHGKLFSGEYKNLPGYTGDRRWLISEFIFDARINRLVDYQGVRTIDGQKRTVIGDIGVGPGTRFRGQCLRQRLTNPFLLPDQISVRYYSNDALTGGHLLTMISNARKIAA